MPDRRRLLQGAAALVALPAFGQPRAPDVSRFPLGIASGHPQPGGVVLWTRLVGADLPERVTVRWELADDPAFARIVARGDETAEAAWAHSVHAEPSGLAPDRWYHYRFHALGQTSPVGRTRTAPAPDAPARLRLVLASCQRYDQNQYAAWRHAAESEPDAIAFVGDYIYENPARDAIRPLEAGIVRTLDGYRGRYAHYKGDPLLQRAHAVAPWITVWDDHEVENDYAGLSNQALQPEAMFAERRAAAYQAYWEHMPFPKSARPQGADMRIYGRIDWGRLARLHLLDDRQYRDPQACPKPGRGGSNTIDLKDCPALLDPKRSLLGAAQERWLAEGWDTARPWNVVVQQTLMSRFAWGEPGTAKARYWNDGWDGYAPARNRLLTSFADRKARGLVVLGGDVHSHYVSDLKADYDDPKAPIVGAEFCGSSIASLSMAQSRVDAVLPLNPHVHLGRSDVRGYVALDVRETGIESRLYAVDKPSDPASTVRLLATFQVDPKKPGVIDA